MKKFGTLYKQFSQSKSKPYVVRRDGISEKNIKKKKNSEDDLMYLVKLV